MWGNTQFLRLVASRWWCKMNEAGDGKSVISKRQLRSERRARDVVAWKGVCLVDQVVDATDQWRKVGRVDYGNVARPLQVEMDGWTVMTIPAGSLVCLDRRRIVAGQPASCEIIRQGNGLVRVNLWARACGYAGVALRGEIRPGEVCSDQ